MNKTVDNYNKKKKNNLNISSDFFLINSTEKR